MTIPVTEGYVGEPGERTWYQVLGDPTDRPPVLMLHGGPGGPWPEHLDAVDAIARDRQVVLYHQLGCGRSDDPGDPSRWTVDAFVDELERLRTHLDLRQVHLHGWSWGGMLAVAAALRRPEGVRSLTLASPVISSALWAQETGHLRDALPPRVVRGLRRHEDRYRPKEPEPYPPRPGRSAAELRRGTGVMRRAMPLLDTAVARNLGIAMSHVPFLRKASHSILGFTYIRRHVMRAREIPPALFTMFTGMNGRLFEGMWGPAEWWCTGTLRDVDLTPRLGDVDVPVLVLSGRHDEATPAQMQAIVDHVPDGRWVVFEDSAHCAILEEPDHYARVVNDFLEGVDAMPVR